MVSLEEKLEASQLRTEQGSFFIPRGVLEEILDEPTICRAIQDLFPALDPKEAAHCASVIRGQGAFPHNEKSFCKIFSILVLSNTVRSIRYFINLGLNDSYLPMPDPRLEGSSDSLHSIEEDVVDYRDRWESLWNMWSRSNRRIFFMSQWTVMAPVFRSVDRVKHFSFSQNYILPFLKNKSPIPPDPNFVSELPNSGQARYGGYSEVRQIKIHPDHYDFGNYGLDNPYHLFALKRLHTHKKVQLWQEADVLKRFRNTAHILQLLATFEVHEDTFGDTLTSYYLIFPWAAGDLESLWTANQNSVGDSRIATWIAQQCYELAKAVSTIHQDEYDQGNSDAGHIYGRHGDIKPANILWFPWKSDNPDSNLGQLALGDFGLAHFHSEHSRSNVDPRNVARSPKYRAPEFDAESKISRKIDIWMLGCTFLEFNTWFLMGLDAVLEEFPNDRSEPDVNDIYADTFFRVVTEGRHVIKMVKPQVKAWISSLHSHERCTEYIHDFLELIENSMLKPDPTLRLSAFEISLILERQYNRCKEDHAYYQLGQPWVVKNTSEERERSSHDGKLRGLERVLQTLRLNAKRVDRER